MKTLLAVLAVCSFASTASAETVRYEATITKAITNAMFPVSTFRLSFEVPCSGSVVEEIQKEENGKLRLGVIIEAEVPVLCEALPRLQSIDFDIDTMSGPANHVEIVNPAPGVRIELGNI